MDKRGTLSANENFIEKLKQYYDNKDKVSMIIEDGGMERKEGFIKSIHFDAQPPFFELQDGTKINPQHIIAINGTFLSDYSEC
jgi:hypothetical protein